MFDIGWSELLVLAVVAIVVVGPKDLPKVLRALGQLVRKARSMADELKAGVNDLIEESEINEVRKSIHHVSNFDPKTRKDAYIDPTTGEYVNPAQDHKDPETPEVADASESEQTKAEDVEGVPAPAQALDIAALPEEPKHSTTSDGAASMTPKDVYEKSRTEQ